ncbi:hypothetical protein I4U23_015180 [Adineta vaga]|nr:hypothetical protein I4U23_015180 [Adineta vaga]
MVYTIEFSLGLIFEIQAIAISIIIFLYFLQNPRIRLKRHHYSWLALLTLNFFKLILDLPIALNFYYQEKLWPESYIFCTLWVWLDFSLSCATLYLTVWISIERHLIIFHSPTLFEGRWQKWIFRIVPIIICLIVPPILYFNLIVIPPQCTNIWDSQTLLCGPPCYSFTGFYGIFDFIFNICAPLLITIFVNLMLIIRVIKGKVSRQQAIEWRHHRKMILQFSAITVLQLAFSSPLVTVSFIQMTVMPSFMADQYSTLEYIFYYMPLLLPATCLCGIPELVKKIYGFIFNRRTNTVTAGKIPSARQKPANSF